VFAPTRLVQHGSTTTDGLFDGSGGFEGVRMHATALESRYISSMGTKPLDRRQLKLPSWHDRFAKKDLFGIRGFARIKDTWVFFIFPR
jgi:hypothetical protein